MENEKQETLATPQAEEQSLTVECEGTTPSAQTDEGSKKGITLKFNKEIREIPYEEAVELAQKGLKFDTIRSDFEKIKSICAKNGKSVSQFITEIENEQIELRRKQLLESCAGNEELAEHILSLENEKKVGDNGLSELTAEFPEIKSLEDLPQEVLDSVELLGGNVLSAYLLYSHRQARSAQASLIKQKQSSISSVGSLSSGAKTGSSADDEFIKAIWN